MYQFATNIFANVVVLFVSLYTHIEVFYNNRVLPILNKYLKEEFNDHYKLINIANIQDVTIVSDYINHYDLQHYDLVIYYFLKNKQIYSYTINDINDNVKDLQIIDKKKYFMTVSIKWNNKTYDIDLKDDDKHNFYISNNRILYFKFVQWYMYHKYDEFVQNEDNYVITIIDHLCNIIEFNQNQCLQFDGKKTENYTILDLNKDKNNTEKEEKTKIPNYNRDIIIIEEDENEYTEDEEHIEEENEEEENEEEENEKEENEEEEEEDENIECSDCDIILDRERDGNIAKDFRCNNCYWEDKEGNNSTHIIKPDYRNKKKESDEDEDGEEEEEEMEDESTENEDEETTENEYDNNGPTICGDDCACDESINTRCNKLNDIMNDGNISRY